MEKRFDDYQTFFIASHHGSFYTSNYRSIQTNSSSMMIVDQKQLEQIMHKNVSRETLEQLQTYISLLLDWNKRINLIGRMDPSPLWQRHILDCAQLLPLLPKGATRVIDIGCGAGLPGIIVAILSNLSVDLIESNGRKGMFLQEVISRLGLADRVHLFSQRVEELTPWKSDVVMARAVAPMPRLLKFSHHFIGQATFSLFLKGQNVVEEIKEATKCWEIEYERLPSATSQTGCIIKISRLESNKKHTS